MPTTHWQNQWHPTRKLRGSSSHSIVDPVRDKPDGNLGRKDVSYDEGSGAVVPGEGFIRRFVSYPMETGLPAPGLRARLCHGAFSIFRRESEQKDLSGFCGVNSRFYNAARDQMFHHGFFWVCWFFTVKPQGRPLVPINSCIFAYSNFAPKIFASVMTERRRSARVKSALLMSAPKRLAP